MAEQMYYIGSEGPYFYDDAEPAEEFDGKNRGAITASQIRITTPSTQQSHVLRRQDLAVFLNDPEIENLEINIITNLIINTASISVVTSVSGDGEGGVSSSSTTITYVTSVTPETILVTIPQFGEFNVDDDPEG